MQVFFFAFSSICWVGILPLDANVIFLSHPYVGLAFYLLIWMFFSPNFFPPLLLVMFSKNNNTNNNNFKKLKITILRKKTYSYNKWVFDESLRTIIMKLLQDHWEEGYNNNNNNIILLAEMDWHKNWCGVNERDLILKHKFCKSTHKCCKKPPPSSSPSSFFVFFLFFFSALLVLCFSYNLPITKHTWCYK
jgi:hypothetical protein